MKDLDDIIKEQMKCSQQAVLCERLLKLYNLDPHFFKELISPRFEKVFSDDITGWDGTPYDDCWTFWDYCIWISNIISGSEPDGRYPIIVKPKKNKGGYIDFVRSKKKGQAPDHVISVINCILGYPSAYSEEQFQKAMK